MLLIITHSIIRWSFRVLLCEIVTVLLLHILALDNRVVLQSHHRLPHGETTPVSAGVVQANAGHFVTHPDQRPGPGDS